MSAPKLSPMAQRTLANLRRVDKLHLDRVPLPSGGFGSGAIAYDLIGPGGRRTFDLLVRLELAELEVTDAGRRRVRITDAGRQLVDELEAGR